MVHPVVEKSVQAIKQIKPEQAAGVGALLLAAGIGAVALKRSHGLSKVAKWGKEQVSSAGNRVKRLGAMILKRNKVTNDTPDRPTKKHAIAGLEAHGIAKEDAAEKVAAAVDGQDQFISMAVSDEAEMVAAYAKPIDGTPRGKLRDSNGTITNDEVREAFLTNGRMIEITYRQPDADSQPILINRIHELVANPDGGFLPVAIVTDVDANPFLKEPVVSRRAHIYGGLQLPEAVPATTPADQ